MPAPVLLVTNTVNNPNYVNKNSLKGIFRKPSRNITVGGLKCPANIPVRVSSLTVQAEILRFEEWVPAGYVTLNLVEGDLKDLSPRLQKLLETTSPIETALEEDTSENNPKEDSSKSGNVPVTDPEKGDLEKAENAGQKNESTPVENGNSEKSIEAEGTGKVSAEETVPVEETTTPPVSESKQVDSVGAVEDSGGEETQTDTSVDAPVTPVEESDTEAQAPAKKRGRKPKVVEAAE